MDSEFMRMQREATEQLRLMNLRAAEHKKETKPEAKKPQKNAPFDGDKTVLLFLLFLLYSDGGDNLLMLALLYLLM